MQKVSVYLFKIIAVSLLLFLNSNAGHAEGVIINEIMYDPQGSDTNYEWVELYNSGLTDVTLSTSWRFFDGSTHPLSLYQGTWTIPAQGYAVLADNGATFTSAYGTNTGIIICTAMNLVNSTATVALINPSGDFIGSVTYSSASGGNGTGKSLERTSPEGNEWKESKILGGTPGKKNSVAIVETGTATTRVKIHPVSGRARLGGTYTVEIRIEDVVGLIGWQFSLYFNSSILQPLTIENGNFMGSNSTQIFWYPPNIGTGSITNAICAKMGTNSIPVDGSGTLARVRFRTIGTLSTSSLIDIGYLTLSGVHGSPIMASAVDGSVSVSYGFDINNDNKVNIHDLVIAGELFGTNEGDKEYNAGYDINLDGVIDLYDLVAISTNFSESPDIKVQQSPELFDSNTGIIGLYTSSSMHEIGDEFELDLRVNDVTNLYGIQFGVEFNPDILTLIRIEPGEFLGKDNRFGTFWVESSKFTCGIKKLAQCRVGKVFGATGQGVIARLKVKAKAEGNTEIRLKDIMALSPDMNQIPMSSMNTSINIIPSKALSPDNIAYPNPSLDNQHIRFSPSDLIEIYTLSGELVKIIEQGNSWDLTNVDNKPVASGIYLYILKTGNKILQGKVGVVK